MPRPTRLRSSQPLTAAFAQKQASATPTAEEWFATTAVVPRHLTRTRAKATWGAHAPLGGEGRVSRSRCPACVRARTDVIQSGPTRDHPGAGIRWSECIFRLALRWPRAYNYSDLTTTRGTRYEARSPCCAQLVS